MAGFGIQTLIVAVVLGGIVISVAWKRPFQVLAALLILLPFRDLSIRWMNASTDLSPDWVNALSRWWFIIVLGLLVVIVVQWGLARRKDRNLGRMGLVEIAFILVILVAGISTFLSPNFTAGFTSLRGYLQPMAVFVLARAIRPTRKQLQQLLILLLIVGVLMAAFEVWQVTDWSADDYRARGYLDQSGRLVNPTITVRDLPYLRPTSTVSGPNELGVDMLLLMLIAVFGAFHSKGAHRIFSILLIPIFALMIILTFSRSAILGTLTSLIIVAMLIIRQGIREEREKRRNRPRVLISAVGLLILVIAILQLTGALQFIQNTIATITTQFHFIDSVEALQYLIKNPAGVGMGMVTPKGALILIETEALFHVEGSLFQIAMEMGVWGLVLWLFFWGVCFFHIWREWPKLQDPFLKIIVGTALSGWVGALVAFLFLPLMQSISLMVWLWFFLGAALQTAQLEETWTS
jgi:hypothetical protein